MIYNNFMKKTLFSALLFSTLLTANDPACNDCSVSKEYAKCTFYVEKKGDLNWQSSCLVFARSIEVGSNFGRASWYYLVGGDFDNAIKAGNRAVEVGELYAVEYVAQAYVLKGDMESAKKYFRKIDTSADENRLLLKKHLEILRRVYPDKLTVTNEDNLIQN